MGRLIRMKSREALAAGLLDPQVSRIRKAKTGGKSPVANLSPAPVPAGSAESGAGTAPQRRRRRKPRREAPCPAIPLSKASDATSCPSAAAEPAGASGAKRRRSKSRPAMMPSPQVGLPGRGKTTLLADGRIQSIAMELDVVPVPKERARTVRIGRDAYVKTVSYTPKRTKYFTRQVEMVARHVVDVATVMESPVRLTMEFVIAAPRSWPKWKREAAIAGIIAPTGRPDMDNLEKALLDALNGIVFEDDALVVQRGAEKLYGETPGIRVRCDRVAKLGVHATRADVELMAKLAAEAAAG